MKKILTADLVVRTSTLSCLQIDKMITFRKYVCFFMIIFFALTYVTDASAHGYVESLQSRAYMCKTGLNQKCGSVQYEPQSLEAKSGSFLSGSLNDRMGSAGISTYSDLDEQLQNRWTKNPISSGTQNFKWVFTANHKTNYFKFYITKENWNPNAPLTISTFDPIALSCTPEWNAPQQPTKSGEYFSCQIPSRTGYQVIMAVWEVNDTVNSFYNLIDVDFGGNTIPDQDTHPIQLGSISANSNLNIGDQVSLITIKKDGSTTEKLLLTINSNDEGQGNTWSYNAAMAINANYNGQLKSGIKNTDNLISPNYGLNNIYAIENSIYNSTDIKITSTGPVYSELAIINNLKPEYTISNNIAYVNFDIESKYNKKITSTIKLTTHHGAPIAEKIVEVGALQSKHVIIPLSNISAGMIHMYVINHAENQPLEQKDDSFYLVNSNVPDNEVNVTLYGTVNYYQGSSITSYDSTIKARNWYQTYSIGKLNLSKDPVIVSAWGMGYNTLQGTTCPVPSSDVTSVHYVVTDDGRAKLSCEIK